MAITIAIHHTAAWVREQRLATGSNVPTQINVLVDPADLPREIREIIMTPDGYQDVDGLIYNKEYLTDCRRTQIHGRARIMVDDAAPTNVHIAEAIMSAFRWIEDQRAAYIIERDRRQANEDAAAAAKLARERALAGARELLASELDDFRSKIIEQQEEIRRLQRCEITYDEIPDDHEAEADEDADD